MPRFTSRLRRVVSFALAFALTLSAHAATFNVITYGAKGDSTTLDTAAIQRAIDDAAAHGGTVIVPAGTYLTGSIFVKSGVTLDIEKGATILGSQHLADYPEMPTRIAGIEMTWPAALVNVYQQSNATITGEGTIDGDGKVWWDSYWALRAIEAPKGLRWASDYDAKRPRLIQIYKSSNVNLDGHLLLTRSGFWTVHICFSYDVHVEGITIRNNVGGRGPSTDGVDIDSSHNILVEHADISVNDDALCLKSGRDSDGLRVNIPTENVVLRDSIIRDGAAGVTIGSETSGGFRNIEAYNITTLNGVPGILFKSAHTRGGNAENIRIHDMTMTDPRVVLGITMNWNPSYSYATIPADLKTYPSYYKILATPVPAAQGLPHFRDVHIWNIKATGSRTAFNVSAYPNAPLLNFTLDHLNIQAATAGHIDDAQNWKFSDISLTTTDHTTVTLKDDKDITGLP